MQSENSYLSDFSHRRTYNARIAPRLGKRFPNIATATRQVITNTGNIVNLHILQPEIIPQFCPQLSLQLSQGNYLRFKEYQ